MVFLGYEPGSAAYRVLHPPTCRVHVSRDVVFDEDGAWDWDADPGGANHSSALEMFIVELEHGLRAGPLRRT